MTPSQPSSPPIRYRKKTDMNATLIRSDVRRFLRAPEALFFTIGLPILMYIIFGGTAEYGEMPIDTAISTWPSLLI